MGNCLKSRLIKINIYPERHMNRVYFEYIHKEPLIVANDEEND